MRAFTCSILALLLSFGAFGQALANVPNNRPTGVRFEVASVKPVLNWPPLRGAAGERGAAGGGCPTSMRVDPGRVDLKCTTLRMLIGYAFRISPDRVTGPEWMMAIGSPRFDIVATIPQAASKNQVAQMFQTLLAERFQLVIHRENATVPVYALVVAKGGLKIKEAAPQGRAGTPSVDLDPAPGLDEYYGTLQSLNDAGAESVTMISNPRMGRVRQIGDPYRVQRWEAPNISIGGLADLLDRVAPLELPVIDMTGVGGRYQLVLEVSLSDLPGARRFELGAAGAPLAAENPVTDMEDTVLKAFNNGLLKLGLRLEPRKGPLETIVVDRAEKTPTEN
jgi:uncharacterized protein (TIGR03435 family)